MTYTEITTLFMRETGIYQKLGNLDYFVPYPLPPTGPSLQMDAEMLALYGETSFALGQLNEMGKRIPDVKRFIKTYIIKEALLSSAIEGIHTTLVETFTIPLEKKLKFSKDTQLVLNYTNALDTALNMLEKDGLPLVSRVILQAHKVLMSIGEGGKSDPGAFRQQSVRVGKLVPPPATEIDSLMSKLEKFINEDTTVPPLIQAGLAHVHFETIHPFLDGNGRIGRLLIVLILIYRDLLQAPILYPSYYFKKHHAEYYQHLDRVRTLGDFEGWIKYYLRGIRDSAIDAHRRAKEIESLEINLKTLIQTAPSFAKMRETATGVLETLFSQPITNVATLIQQLGKSYNTIHHILQEFVANEIVVVPKATKRNQLYHFKPYLELLEKEYE